jgi:hypothetical protein
MPEQDESAIAAAERFWNRYEIPFEHDTAIKVRRSGLLRGSSGTGHARDTVVHLHVKEAFTDGRLSRSDDSWLCENDSHVPVDGREERSVEDGEEYVPPVTCETCLDRMKRWKVAVTDGGSNPDEPEVHSEGDRIVATANGGVVEAEWETMKRLAKEILSEAENHKTDLQKAKEMAAGVHIRLSCENCEVEHEAEYARDLIETPQEHVDYPDDDCTLDDVTIEAFCPRHGTVPLSYDECDSCASDRAVMNR